MTSTALLLDKAKAKHHLASDYKLALVMGVSQSTLANYRTGKTLPDTRVISKICDLTGDDSALIAVEFEVEKATTPEAKSLWLSVAKRMQMGFAGVGMMLVLAIASIAAYALPVTAALYLLVNAVTATVYYVKQWTCAAMRFFKCDRLKIVILCKVACDALLHQLFPRLRPA